MKRNKKDSGKSPAGPRFPVDEAKHPWLPVLLRMHALIDAGIAAAVLAEERRRGVRRACRSGCGACCRTHGDIPVFEIELAGLSWYSVEKLEGAKRIAVRAGLGNHVPGDHSCPFLVAQACAVHPLRPMACRLFMVFGHPCAEGEDPFYTRRSDTLAPPQGLLERAYRVMLPFHGVSDPKDQEVWLERGLVKTLSVNFPDCNWSTLARLLD